MEIENEFCMSAYFPEEVIFKFSFKFQPGAAEESLVLFQIIKYQPTNEA